MSEVRQRDLARIEAALLAAAEAIRPFTPGQVDYQVKSDRGDPLTEADQASDRVLRATLPEPGEGWLSEESVDDPARLRCARVWIVDPIDGTREFVDGVPEWCISVGLVENGAPVAGGILNPATDEMVLGSVETGVTFNGEPVTTPLRAGLRGAEVLASRSEIRRGEWDGFDDAGFAVHPCGSVAYKLGQVAARKADATWTLVPKHEWDVAAGAALIIAAGGEIRHADGSTPRFNQPEPRYPNFLAASATLIEEFRTTWL